eukprot:163826-Chlamydomonas_euryale.AAC.1
MLTLDFNPMAEPSWLGGRLPPPPPPPPQQPSWLGGSLPPPPHPQQHQPQQQVAVGDLIDFGDEPSGPLEQVASAGRHTRAAGSEARAHSGDASTTTGDGGASEAAGCGSVWKGGQGADGRALGLRQGHSSGSLVTDHGVCLVLFWGNACLVRCPPRRDCLMLSRDECPVERCPVTQHYT